MKSLHAVCESERVVLKEREIGQPTGREILIKAMYSSMSPGTERMLMAGEMFSFPRNIGYSMIGEVIAVGEEVEDFQVGDYVATSSEHAQYLLVDEWKCTPCPKTVDLRQAAFFTLAHTGLYALRQSGLKFGEGCVVLGQGFVGAITAQCAKIAGAMPVIVTDLNESRLEAARKMGVDYTINSQEEPDGLRRLLDDLRQDGVPVVFEATGARDPIMQGADALGERGRLVLVSTVHGGGMPPIDEILFTKGAHFIGTYVNSKPFRLRRADLHMTDWPPVVSEKMTRYNNSDSWSSDEDIRLYLEMINLKRLDITPLISHEFHYTEIPQAYDQYVWKADPSMTGGLIRWI